MKIDGSTAWRIITQPISKRFLSGVITGLRHRDPAHRFFRAISAWRSSHLSALRHGDPAHRYFRGIPAWRTIPQPLSKRFLSGVITGLRHGDPVQKAQRQPRAISAPSPRHPSAIPAPSPHHPSAIPARRDHHPTDLKTVSFRCHNRSSARRPCPQVLQSHLRVAKQSYIGPSARRPCLQAPQSHLQVAK